MPIAQLLPAVFHVASGAGSRAWAVEAPDWRRRALAAEARIEALEHRVAEQQRSAERLDVVLQGGSLGFWELHVPSGRFQVNEREWSLLGHDDPGARPHHLDWRSLIHPDDRPALHAALALHLAGEAPFYACDVRLRHRDGHWLWARSQAVVVERDAAGTPLRIVGTHADIGAQRRDRDALERARDLLQRMGACAHVGGWELEIATGALTWTEEVFRIHELDPTTDLSLHAGLEFYAPAARPLIGAAVAAAIADGTPWDLELPFVTARGRALTVRAKGEAVRVDGRTLRLFGTFQDVTDRKAIEQAALDSQRRLRLVADHLPALVAHIDADERYTFLNAQVQRAHGVDPNGALGRTMREVRGAAVYAQLAPHVAAALRGEKRSFTYTETFGERSVHYRSNYVPDVAADGRVGGFYAMTFDVTEQHEAQRRLELLARADTLTGLANRRCFDETLQAAMLRTRRTARPLAVLFLDIDRFKQINDRHGHAAGDAVLCEVARRLVGCVRATDLVARLAGDEFVLVLEGVDDADGVGRVAEKIVGCVRPPLVFEAATLAVTVSVGVTLYGGGEPTAADVLALADAALYQAKQQGRDRFVLN